MNNIDRLYNNIERMISDGRLEEIFTKVSNNIGKFDEVGMPVSISYLNDRIEEVYDENYN